MRGTIVSSIVEWAQVQVRVHACGIGLIHDTGKTKDYFMFQGPGGESALLL